MIMCDIPEELAYTTHPPLPRGTAFPLRCKVAPESWGIGEFKVVSSKGLEGYEMFDPRDSRREDREEENA